MSKPLPKSLHTVTVLVKLAHHFDTEAPGFTLRNREQAMVAARAFLGYADCTDTHNLAGAALKAMSK